MNLQEELKALKERIAELEEQAKDEEKFPQYGDTHWYINTYGAVSEDIWEEHVAEKNMIKIGNVFRTEQEAEFAVEKLKVEAELRKFSRPFKSDVENFSITFNTITGNLNVWYREYNQSQGTIHFESEEKARQTIKIVGEHRIKKYLFGVED